MTAVTRNWLKWSKMQTQPIKYKQTERSGAVTTKDTEPDRDTATTRVGMTATAYGLHRAPCTHRSHGPPRACPLGAAVDRMHAPAGKQGHY